MALSRRVGSSLLLMRQLINPELMVPLRSLANPNLAVSEGSRTFATQAKSSGAKPLLPRTLFGGSGNYATALYLAAAKSDSIEKVESEILDVVQASKKCAIFSQFMKDLSVPKETRVKAIKEIFGEAGFSDITKNFLAVCADNGRLRNLEHIAKRFFELCMAHKGEIKIIVTSVIPLPESEEKELKKIFDEIFGQVDNNITIKVEQKIDPSLLGGLVVEFGNFMMDLSIKTRAKQMENYLREPIHF